MSARTVSRVLARHQMPRLCALDPITGQVIRASKATAVRYERDRPGELVHMDVKKIGRIPDGGGWRAHGREQPRAHPRRRHKVGFDYVHSWSTTTPGWPTPRSCPTRRAATCAAFLTRADRLLRRPRHHPHRAVDDRQRLGLPMVATRGLRRATASPRSSSSRTARGRTARWNASTEPWPPNGPTGKSSPATTNAQQPLRPGWSYYNTRRRHSALGGLPTDQPTVTNVSAGYR